MNRALATVPALTLTGLVLLLGSQPASAGTLPLPPLQLPISLPTLPITVPLLGQPTPTPKPTPKPMAAPTPTATAGAVVTAIKTPERSTVTTSTVKQQAVRANSVYAVPAPQTAALSAANLQGAPLPAAAPQVPTPALAPLAPEAPAVPSPQAPPAAPTTTAALRLPASSHDLPEFLIILAGLLVASAGTANVAVRRAR